MTKVENNLRVNIDPRTQLPRHTQIDQNNSGAEKAHMKKKHKISENPLDGRVWGAGKGT